MASVDLGAGRYPVAIAAGRWHTCALLDNDDVKVGRHVLYLSTPVMIYVVQAGVSQHNVPLPNRFGPHRCILQRGIPW